MKYVIIGRSGTGKSTLAEALRNIGISVLKTCTDRPKRRPDEDSYHFMTKQQADDIPPEEKILETVLNGHRRFAMRSDLKNAKVMVLDPKGLREIAEAYPEEQFGIIYVSAYPAQAREHAMYRQDDIQSALKEFDMRREDETNMFDEFGKKMNAARLNGSEILPDYPDNIRLVFDYHCDFTENTLKSAVHILAVRILNDAFGISSKPCNE